MKPLSQLDIYNKFIKNRYAMQNPIWITELRQEFLTKGYAKLENGGLIFEIEPTPQQVSDMLRDTAALLPLSRFEARFFPWGRTLPQKIRRSFVLGLLIAFLILDAFGIYYTLHQKRRKTHEQEQSHSSNHSHAIILPMPRQGQPPTQGSRTQD